MAEGAWRNRILSIMAARRQRRKFRVRDNPQRHVPSVLLPLLPTRANITSWISPFTRSENQGMLISWGTTADTLRGVRHRSVMFLSPIQLTVKINPHQVITRSYQWCTGSYQKWTTAKWMTFQKPALYGHFKEGIALISEIVSLSGSFLKSHIYVSSGSRAIILGNKNKTRKHQWRSSENTTESGGICLEGNASPMMFVAGRKTAEGIICVIKMRCRWSGKIPWKTGVAHRCLMLTD